MYQTWLIVLLEYFLRSVGFIKQCEEALKDLTCQLPVLHTALLVAYPPDIRHLYGSWPGNCQGEMQPSFRTSHLFQFSTK